MFIMLPMWWIKMNIFCRQCGRAIIVLKITAWKIQSP